jgi:peptide/nickel transport system substrate-binding protein
MMKKTLLFSVLILLLIGTTLLSACTETQTTSATQSTSQSPISTTASVTPSATTQSAATSTAAAQANWWDKLGEPKYGGTITFPYSGLANITFDNYSLIGSDYQFWLEAMFSKINWTVDRSEWGYITDFTPEQYITGNLAQSWERPDLYSLVIHLREDVYWQDKAPVNGRQFTAYDVETHYNRMLGTGDGYTTPAPTYTGFTPNWGKVVAVDEHTVKLSFTKSTGNIGLLSIMETMALNTIEAPEWVALGNTTSNSGTANPLTDWHNAVGTGAWMLTDYVENSSLTYTKNPNYWAYDERYPENKLPYAGELKILIIGDTATKIAALRTGKIDSLNAVTQTQLKTLTESNPELESVMVLGGANGVTLRVDKEPFTDIRVRTALQMSIDLSAIAVQNGVEATPVGFISPLLKGCYYPYEEWTQDLKDEFAYNTTGAKALLAEAGYPNGFDTNVIASTANQASVETLQVLKAYFLDIGVDMEIKLMDMVAQRAYTAAGKHDQMTSGGGAFAQAPTSTLGRFVSTNKSVNEGFVNDPNYDAIITELYNVTSAQGISDTMKKADRYITEQHWGIYTLPSATYYVWQPYLKGYSGEVQLRYGQGGWIFARMWVGE